MLQPVHGVVNDRIFLSDHRFQIVMSLSFKKVGYFDWRTIACQCRMIENFSGRDMCWRHNKQIIVFRWINRRQNFASAFCPGRVAMNKNRYISTQRDADFGQIVICKIELPEDDSVHITPSPHRSCRHQDLPPSECVFRSQYRPRLQSRSGWQACRAALTIRSSSSATSDQRVTLLI